MQFLRILCRLTDILKSVMLGSNMENLGTLINYKQIIWNLPTDLHLLDVGWLLDVCQSFSIRFLSFLILSCEKICESTKVHQILFPIRWLFHLSTTLNEISVGLVHEPQMSFCSNFNHFIVSCSFQDWTDWMAFHSDRHSSPTYRLRLKPC